VCMCDTQAGTQAHINQDDGASSPGGDAVAPLKSAITKPLLKKLMNKELESEEAVKCYLDIFCYLLLIGVL